MKKKEKKLSALKAYVNMDVVTGNISSKTLLIVHNENIRML